MEDVLCKVVKTTARSDVSSIVLNWTNSTQSITMTEYQGDQNVRDAIIECMKDVYLPYDVEITTQRPSNQTIYHRAILAGDPKDIDPNADQNQTKLARHRAGKL